MHERALDRVDRRRAQVVRAAKARAKALPFLRSSVRRLTAMRNGLANARSELSDAERERDRIRASPDAEEEEVEAAEQRVAEAEQEVVVWARRVAVREATAAELRAQHDVVQTRQIGLVRNLGIERLARFRAAHALRRALAAQARIEDAHWDEIGQVLDRARAADARVVRFYVKWNRVEEEQGEFDFAIHDRAYEELLRRGIRPLLVVLNSPCWAHPSTPCGSEFIGADGELRPYRSIAPDPRAYADWSRFVAGVVRRYPAAVGLEVWNEPNMQPFWGPSPDVSRYLELLRLADQQARSIRPRLPVVFAGLSPATSADRIGVPWRTYLSDAYARGAAVNSDVLGVHTYPVRPYPDDSMRASVKEQLAAAIEVRDAYDPQAPVWVTEAGVSTAVPGVGSGRQARLLRWMHGRFRRVGAAVAFYNRLGPSDGLDPWEAGMSLILPDGRPTAAYCALAEANGAAPLACSP